MRAKLATAARLAKVFRIGFDAYNTLVHQPVAEEMRTRHIWHASVLSPEAKTAGSRRVHGAGERHPSDPVSTSSIDRLGPRPKRPPAKHRRPRVNQRARFVVAGPCASRPGKHPLPVTSKRQQAAALGVPATN